MSFCYLLNAILLCTGVFAFLLAGFAGTFSRHLHPGRYRLMLSPLGFVVVGSIAHSAAMDLASWLLHSAAALHPAQSTIGVSSPAEIIATVALIFCGLAGALAGVSLGSTLDRAQAVEPSSTIADYWRRASSRLPIPTPEKDLKTAARRGSVIAISNRKVPPAAPGHANTFSEKK